MASLNNKVNGVKIHTNCTNGLLYADDAVIFADSVQDMEISLLQLQDYCVVWEF